MRSRTRSAIRSLLPARLRASIGAARNGILRRYTASLGYDLVRRGFYSPIPSSEDLPADVWTRRSPLEGIDFDTGKQLDFVTRNLAPYLSEFDPAFDTATSYGRYDIRNLAYDEVDSELLYAFVRFLRPNRVVELGSGFSSLVLAHACRANVSKGDAPVYSIFDPFPQPWVRERPAGVTELTELPAQQVPIEDFERLEEGDILFVDTTHTVKIGSEVNRIVLDVLPRLARGVVVQFHDIFLPWEYHRNWIEGDWKWNEQYLLQAMLSMNTGYEVLVSCQALVREHAEELSALIPTMRPASAPSAFWIRRR